jgi:hypothetical protein
MPRLESRKWRDDNRLTAAALLFVARAPHLGGIIVTAMPQRPVWNTTPIPT